MRDFRKNNTLLFYTQILLITLVLILPFKTYALPQDKTLQNNADLSIQIFYREHLNFANYSLPERLVLIGSQFLNEPYQLFPLGDGENAYFDQYPLYRLDTFDCETFVETVMALSLATDLSTFKNILKNIRYKKGQISFIKRHHFTSLDWNPENQRAGFIRDISAETLARAHAQPPLVASAYINKSNWYQHVAKQRVRLLHASPDETQKRIHQLEQLGKTITGGNAKVPYIPFDVLFDEKNQANQAIFNEIPNGAILEIIRPHWDLTASIGTPILVSHMGFVARHNQKLYFLQASSIAHKITKTPLIDYLREAKKIPSIGGVNLQRVIEPPISNFREHPHHRRFE